MRGGDRNRNRREAGYNPRMKLLALALTGSLVFGAASSNPAAKTLGSPSAAMRLELYCDFASPLCKSLHEMVLPQLVKDYVDPRKAYVVFRYYPESSQGNQLSREAAQLAAAAARIGRYEDAADAIYRTQQYWVFEGNVWQHVTPTFTPNEQKRIQALVKEPAIAGDVQADFNSGKMLPVLSVPTLVIIAKGKKESWTTWTSYPLLKSHLDQLVQ